ncbi:MAG: hypothetical protein ABJA86_09260 [Nocardioidaceae bacterium]
MDRVQKALSVIDLAGRGLEIGPSYSPLIPKSSGARIETVDHDDREALRTKYQAWGLSLDKIDQIEEVDHIWGGGSLVDVVPDLGAYDYILASHFIEHTVDLIAFLRDCETLLSEHGRLSLVVPDKRFCFDRFQPLTSIGDVIDAHHRPTKFHPPGALLDHQSYACAKDGAIAWSAGDEGQLAAQFPDLQGAGEVIEQGIAQDTYRDTHRWKFTPASFHLLLSDLAALGEHSFGVVQSFPTEGFEFFVTLEKGRPREHFDRIATLLDIEAELAAASAMCRPLTDARASDSIDVLRQRNAALQARIADFESSTSWRATQPLRYASRRFRSLRRRFGRT